MADIEIIGNPSSNFVWATRIAVAEKGVPHVSTSAMPHSPEVNAIHPFGKMPVMRHGDVVLAESRAICGYVDRVFDGPPLLPTDPVQAARVEQWTSIVTTTVEPVMVRQYLLAYFVPGTADGSPDRARIDAALPRMKQQFEILETAMGNGALGGDPFTLVDAFLVPILFYMRTMPESAAALAPMKRLNAYLDRQMARPSVRATTPPKTGG